MTEPPMPPTLEPASPEPASTEPALSAIVVHWRNEEPLARLVAAWPRDSKFELLVVDNSQSLAEVPKMPPNGRILTPNHNLGFGGGVNRGVAAARAPWVLVLNADIVPLEGALESLLEAIDRWPAAAGVVPALVGPEGDSQCRWQLQPLPSPATLLLQTFFLGGLRGPSQPPAAGSRIEQPAAAALALRREMLVTAGGFDEGFYPAWFEDVDLAKRLQNRGAQLLYAPEARFEHAMGGTVPSLGYGRFLWIYYRNLCRYLGKHHGVLWSSLARLSLPLAMAARILLLPLRVPRRALGMADAARGLLTVTVGALSGWRWPASMVSLVTAPEDESGANG